MDNIKVNIILIIISVILLIFSVLTVWVLYLPSYFLFIISLINAVVGLILVIRKSANFKVKTIGIFIIVISIYFILGAYSIFMTEMAGPA